VVRNLYRACPGGDRSATGPPIHSGLKARATDRRRLKPAGNGGSTQPFKLWSTVELTVLAPLFAKACGKVAGPILQKAAERHVESFFGEQLRKLAKLGKKDEVVEATRNAYALWFEWMLKNVQSLGYDEAELKEYEEAAERLLDDEAVFHELLKPVRDSDEEPDLDVLRDAWKRHDCPPLPTEEGFSCRPPRLPAAGRETADRAGLAAREARRRSPHRDPRRPKGGALPGLSPSRGQARCPPTFRGSDSDRFGSTPPASAGAPR